jgi:hypothetical protein
MVKRTELTLNTQSRFASQLLVLSMATAISTAQPYPHYLMGGEAMHTTVLLQPCRPVMLPSS